MTDQFEKAIQPPDDPAEALRRYVNARQTELVYLQHNLAQGMELVEDVNRVNNVLAASARPDLVITDRASMMGLDSPSQVDRRINNFIPNWQGFGMPVTESKQGLLADETASPYVDLRPLTAEERKLFFFMGARGEYKAHCAFAVEHGIDADFASDILISTHINSEAFMRMWILMPELTEKLMDTCLRTRGRDYSEIKEEFFVAYSMMSRLVDKSDVYVMRDGQVDDWVLCR